VNTEKIRDCPRLQAFIEQARQYPSLRLAVVNAEETHVLQGTMEARAEGLVEPVLIGDATTIRQLCQQLGFSLDGIRLLDSRSEEEAVQQGIDLVVQGEVDALAKGWIHTDALMRPVLAEHRVSLAKRRFCKTPSTWRDCWVLSNPRWPRYLPWRSSSRPLLPPSMQPV